MAWIFDSLNEIQKAKKKCKWTFYKENEWKQMKNIACNYLAQ